MASAAQERANRLNAARSSGPRTVAGKEKTKFNATRHGLTSTQVVLAEPLGGRGRYLTSCNAGLRTDN